MSLFLTRVFLLILIVILILAGEWRLSVGFFFAGLLIVGLAVLGHNQLTSFFFSMLVGAPNYLFDRTNRLFAGEVQWIRGHNFKGGARNLHELLFDLSIISFALTVSIYPDIMIWWYEYNNVEEYYV